MDIADNISHIIEFYEQEGIHHEQILLLYHTKDEDVVFTFKELQKKLPKVEINYELIQKNEKNLCSPSNNDLIIQIPLGMLKATSGKFKFKFQSRVKNIFGTLEVEVVSEHSKIKAKNLQVFSTSIGQ